MNPDVTAVADALDACTLVLRGKPSRSRFSALGVALKPVMAGKVNLGGNQSFSGWTRSKPIDLEVAFALHTDDAGITMHRKGASAGPWRVAEEGRKAGQSRGAKGGQRRRQKDGNSRVSVARSSRRVGAMAGKRQWTAAGAAAAEKAPELLTRAIVADVQNAFTGR